MDTTRMGATPRRPIDATTTLIAGAVIALLVIAGNGAAPGSRAAAPPAGAFAHGAAGSGRNGVGGEIATSPTMQSWPGTGSNGNGGPFAFIGAHYGSMWSVPAAHNNSLGVGYCVMEDVGGEGAVSARPDPPQWDDGEMARAAAVMSTFGGDRVVPYGIDASGPYDVASGEWRHPSLLGNGEYTRRRHVAVNFGAKMFVEDVSPTGAVAGLKLARDTAVVNGSGANFPALRDGYAMAQQLAAVADIQHAVGGVQLDMVWGTADGAPPTAPGTYPLAVRATDSTGKPVGFVPVMTLSDVGIESARTVGAAARVDRGGHTADDTARWNAAAAAGWPTMEMAVALTDDRRFAMGANPESAAVANVDGVARFQVAVDGPAWELAFHTQAPTADVTLYAGTGIQGQITWTGRPQSASVHVLVEPPPPTPTAPPTTTLSPPVVRDVAVRKVLDADDVQADRDMSGFEFEVTADDTAVIGGMTTGPDGLTPPIEAPVGTYTLTEVGAPEWAAGFADGGPVTFTIGDDTRNDLVEVTYTNVVPTAEISTAARDARDGDKLVDLANGDATIIDMVTYSGLVPGTEYVARAELMLHPTSAAATSPAGVIGSADNGAGDIVASSTTATLDMIVSGLGGSTRFIPAAADGTVEVEIAVPPDSPLVGHTVVVFQRVEVAASARVVAVHADPAATEQTIRFADPPPPPPPPTVAETVPTTAVAAQPPPPPSTTAAPSPPTSTLRQQLPRTGGNGSTSITHVAVALFAAGIALVLLTARRPTRPRPGRLQESLRHQRNR